MCPFQITFSIILLTLKRAPLQLAENEKVAKARSPPPAQELNELDEKSIDFNQKVKKSVTNEKSKMSTFENAKQIFKMSKPSASEKTERPKLPITEPLPPPPPPRYSMFVLDSDFFENDGRLDLKNLVEVTQ